MQRAVTWLGVSRNNVAHWRYFVAFAHIAILAAALVLWRLNSGAAAARRWSRGSLQVVSRQSVQPTPENWPRHAQSSIACRDPAACRQDESYYVADVYSDESSMSFLANADVAVLAVLSLWVSTSYAVFSIPNEMQRNESRWR